MIKFYTGSSLNYKGDGVYFITPTEGIPYVSIVVNNGEAQKIAELNSITASEVDNIKKELEAAIGKNAKDIETVAAALNAIIQKHGDLLENLEKKVDDNTAAIETNATNLGKVVDGTTPVAKATEATKATQDASGNIITATYATKEELKEQEDYVGTFTPQEGISTVIDYIDKKTESVNNNETVAQIQQDLDTVESYFDENGKAKNALEADHAADASSADKTKGTLTIGEKTFNGSADVEVSAADLGLDNAIHFLGSSESAVTDGGSEQPTIGEVKVTPMAGDIVLWGNQEYIYNSLGQWEVFGNEGSYAIKTQKIEAGEGLTGGGDLSDDRTISHAVPEGAGESKNITAEEGKYVSGITFDKFGHVIGVSTANEKTYEGDKGIEVTSAGKVQHTNSVTAGTAQGSTGAIGFGESINIPTVTYDAQGHVTGSSTTTVTLPSDDRIVALEETLVWYSSENGNKLA